MKKFLTLSKLRTPLLVAALAFPILAMADDVNKVTLNNNSKTADSNGGYYLEQDKIWSDPDCVVYRGEKKVMPGSNTSFEMKKSCVWGTVTFKVYKAKSDQYMGTLAYTLRDGKANIEFKKPCKSDSECDFVGIMPGK